MRVSVSKLNKPKLLESLKEEARTFSVSELNKAKLFVSLKE